jgi:phospholipase/carboxylesterase
MKFDPDAWLMQRPSTGTLESLLILPAKSTPSCFVVMCHGFGAPGTDLVGVFEDVLYHLPDNTEKPAFLFPEGLIDLEADGMPGGRAWWRLNMAKLMQLAATNSFEEMRPVVPDGIDEARSALCECVTVCMEQQNWEDIPIVLGGFSQGAMLTVDTYLRGSLEKVVGLLLFSGALICESKWSEAAKSRTLNVPTVQSHGTLDQILPISTGRWLNEFLVAHRSNCKLIEFRGPHTIPIEAIEAASRLIAESARTAS